MSSSTRGRLIAAPTGAVGKKIPAQQERGFLRLFLRDVVLMVAGPRSGRAPPLPRRAPPGCTFRRVGAAGMELAARGRVGRGRDAALEHHAIHLIVGIGHRDGREERLGIGCMGLAKISSVGANSTMLPRYMTPTVSEMCSTTLKSWLMKRYVRPNSFWSFRSRLMICAWMDTSSAETGSSQRMNSGFKARARAMQILCRWPPENSWDSGTCGTPPGRRPP